MKKPLLLLTLLLCLGLGAYAQSAWIQPDTHQYNDETVVYATLSLNGHAAGADNADYAVAAFIGDECRAVAEEAVTGVGGQTLFVLRVGGDRKADQGSALRFEARYKAKGTTYAVSAATTVTFNSESWGRPSQPVVLSGDGYVPHTSVKGFEWSLSDQPYNRETVQLRLTPRPANATFSPADLRFSYTSDYNWEQVWQIVDLQLVSRDPFIYNVTFQTPMSADIKAYWVDEPDVEVPLWPVGESVAYCAMTAYFRLDLKEGWQWRSNPSGCLWGDDLQTGFGPYLVEARTQDELLYNDPAWGYFGTMMEGNGIDDNMAYKVRMAQDYRSRTFGSSIGTGADYFELPVSEGWTWMPSPYLYDRLLQNIFTTDQLVEGMVIISKEEGSAEWNGSQWEGDLEVLPTEQSFLLYIPEGASFNLRFNPERYMPQGNEQPDASRQSDSRYCSPLADAVQLHSVARRFRDNMTIVATMPDVADAADYELRAYVGDELRGMGRANAAGRFFVTVHADGGERVSFSLVSLVTGAAYDVDEQLTVSRFRLGSLSEPVALHSTQQTQGIGEVRSARHEVRSYDLLGRPTAAARAVVIERTADGRVRKVIRR